MTPQQQEALAAVLAAELWPSDNPPPAGETVRLAVRAAVVRCLGRADSLDAHPLAPVLREVLGLDVTSLYGKRAPVECPIALLKTLADTPSLSERARLIRIAAVALAGIEACDAAERANSEAPPQ